MRTPVLTYRPGLRSDQLGEVFRAVSLPVVIGLAVRAAPVLKSDFPLGDGGLFFAMTRDLQNSHFLIPATTAYNGLGIPFVYPPLSFYVAGGLSSVFGIGLTDLFHYLPLIVATVMIPVVYLLAREILATRFQALLATWAFALLPRSIDWLILGGGLTRSFGFLFAALALVEGLRLYRTGQRRDLVGLAVFASGAILSHPQAAEFVGVSMLLMLGAYGRSARALRDSVIAAALAALLTLPWWWTVITIHGVGPFLSGGQLGLDVVRGSLYLLTFDFTNEPYLTFMAAIGLIGIVRQLAARRYLLPAWVLVLFLIDQRGASTSSMIPLALLIAVGIDEVLLGRLADRGDVGGDPVWPRAVLGDRFGRWMLGGSLAVAIIAALLAPTAGLSPLHAVPTQNRTAMAWIAGNTPPSARFAVVTGVLWFIDANQEWFPVLAGRSSVATLQGYEWLGKERWTGQETLNADLFNCAHSTVDCIHDWTREAVATDAWVYLPRQVVESQSLASDCCGILRASLVGSPDYEVVYDGPGGTVFRPSS